MEDDPLKVRFRLSKYFVYFGLKVTLKRSNDDVTPMTSYTMKNYDVIVTLFSGIVTVKGHDEDSYPSCDPKHASTVIS